MYQSAKKIAKKLIPGQWLRSNEDLLRSLIAWKYRGSQHQCNLCGFHLKVFVQLENGEQLCPGCGSLPRTRRLWMLLENQLADQSVLHFSPPRPLKKCIRNSTVKHYVTSDYEGEFKADLQLNIEKMPEVADASYGLVICYHVLEHVMNDQSAIKELYRILQTGGQCIIQTPFKEGMIYEDDTIVSREERLKHFGQADHVRIYSVEGLKKRLEQAGFEVKVLHFTEATAGEKEVRLGLKGKETILIAQK
jgi:predicted SAM-dependent methyltransferase